MYMSRKMARPNAKATHVASTTSNLQSLSASSRSSALLGVLGGKSGFSKDALLRLAGAWTMGLCSVACLNCSDEGLRRRAGGLRLIVPVFSDWQPAFAAAGPGTLSRRTRAPASVASQSFGSESSEANLVCALRVARAATRNGTVVQVCSRTTRRRRGARYNSFQRELCCRAVRQSGYGYLRAGSSTRRSPVHGFLRLR